MIQAAKSDGSIDAAEKAKITDNLTDATPAEIKCVNGLIAKPVDVGALVRDVPKRLEAQVYAMSVMAKKSHKQSEANYLYQLTQGLGIGQRQVNEIHARLGVPALYTQGRSDKPAVVRIYTGTGKVLVAWTPDWNHHMHTRMTGEDIESTIFE